MPENSSNLNESRISPNLLRSIKTKKRKEAEEDHKAFKERVKNAIEHTGGYLNNPYSEPVTNLK